MIKFDKPLAPSCSSCLRPAVTMLSVGWDNSFTSAMLCEDCLNTLRLQVEQEQVMIKFRERG